MDEAAVVRCYYLAYPIPHTLTRPFSSASCPLLELLNIHSSAWKITPPLPGGPPSLPLSWT